MNLKLELNANSLKAILPALKRAQVPIYGLLLIGVFGYTAYTINSALNVKPAEEQSTVKTLPKISFDKNTMASLHNRDTVSGDVPVDLGATDPFK